MSCKYRFHKDLVDSTAMSYFCLLTAECEIFLAFWVIGRDNVLAVQLCQDRCIKVFGGRLTEEHPWEGQFAH